MLFLIFTEELHGGCHILSCDQMTSNMIGPLHAISFPGRLRIAEWQNVVCTLSIRISFCIKYRVYSYKFYSSNYVLNDICFVLTVRPEGHAIVRCKTWVCHKLAYFHYWPWVPPFCMQWAWKIQIFKCQLIHSTFCSTLHILWSKYAENVECAIFHCDLLILCQSILQGLSMIKTICN